MPTGLAYHVMVMIIVTDKLVICMAMPEVHPSGEPERFERLKRPVDSHGIRLRDAFHYLADAERLRCIHKRGEEREWRAVLARIVALDDALHEPVRRDLS